MTAENFQKLGRLACVLCASLASHGSDRGTAARDLELGRIQRVLWPGGFCHGWSGRWPLASPTASPTAS